MRIAVKGRNTAVSEQLRDHVEKRFDRISRQVSELAELEVELREERNPAIPDNQVAEATIWAKGQTLRGRTASRDMKASIDGLVNNLERQVKRYREKRRRRPSEEHPLAKAPVTPESEPESVELGPLE